MTYTYRVGMNRRTFLGAGAAAATAAAVGAATATEAAAWHTAPPFIFYTPHQDDETIFAGQLIAHQRLIGRRAIIVCGTDGGTNRAVKDLRGETANAWWGGFHDPYREQINVRSYDDLARARDRELVAAAGCLGVNPGDIRLETETRPPSAGPGRDVGITVATAEGLISRYESTYPGALHCTTWWGDGHPDHANLGKALHNLKGRLHAMWVVSYGGSSATAPASNYAAPDAAKLMVKHAVQPYRAWAPVQGMYAVGFHSSAGLLTQAEAGRVNRVVRES